MLSSIIFPSYNIKIVKALNEKIEKEQFNIRLTF